MIVVLQDYEGFDEAIENDRIEEFLKLPRGSLPQVAIITHTISTHSSRDVSNHVARIMPFILHTLHIKC